MFCWDFDFHFNNKRLGKNNTNAFFCSRWSPLNCFFFLLPCPSSCFKKLLFFSVLTVSKALSYIFSFIINIFFRKVTIYQWYKQKYFTLRFRWNPFFSFAFDITHFLLKNSFWVTTRRVWDDRYQPYLERLSKQKCCFWWCNQEINFKHKL